MNSRSFNNNSSNQSSKVIVVDGGHEIVSLSNVRKCCRVLDPCSLEVVMENPLAVSVANTRAKYVHSQKRLSRYT